MASFCPKDINLTGNTDGYFIFQLRNYQLLIIKFACSVKKYGW
jgi:hypothetical protein